MATKQKRLHEKLTVAYLDILGFKDKIEKTPLLDLSERYETAIRIVDAFTRKTTTSQFFTSHPIGKPWCSVFVFSDSLIMIAHDESLDSLLKLLFSVWRTMQAMLQLQLPVRGGIATGEMYVNEADHVFLGKALTRAYELEQAQEWIGVAIDNSVLTSYPDLTAAFATNQKSVLNALYPSYSVPLKQEKSEILHTVNWHFNLVVQKGTKSLFEMHAAGAVKNKVDNTMKYVDFLREKEYLYFEDPGAAPPELQTFWIGDKDPPFEHGDEL